MEFEHCNVKSIKADIAKGEITLSVTMALTHADLAEASRLTPYTEADAGQVRVYIYPQQLPLPMVVDRVEVAFPNDAGEDEE